MEVSEAAARANAGDPPCDVELGLEIFTINDKIGMFRSMNIVGNDLRYFGVGSTGHFLIAPIHTLPENKATEFSTCPSQSETKCGYPDSRQACKWEGPTPSKAMALRFDLGITQLLSDAFQRPQTASPEKAAYERLAAKGFHPDGIIDVGAYQGEWTRTARSVFPDTPVLMIEAQDSKAHYLEAVCASLPDVSYVSAMLGSSPGEQAIFYEMETGSSFLPEQSNVARTERTLTMTTLDEVARDFTGSLFLKIDVQGAELQVLAGGPETLARSAAVQLEVALLAYNKGAPTMIEVVNHMDSCGLVPFDVSGFSRPNGLDLVQIDLIFVRRDSPMRPAFFSF